MTKKLTPEEKAQKVSDIAAMIKATNGKVTGTYIGNSHDAKIGNMSAIYWGRQTCPHCCPHLETNPDSDESGRCYGMCGRCLIHFNKATSPDHTPEKMLERAEKDVRWKYLRVSVTGDMVIPGTLKLNKDAIDLVLNIVKETGSIPYSYTHAPINDENTDLIKYADENGFVINYSCENMEQVKDAMSRGCNANITVATMENRTATVDGVKIVRCPNAENKEITCNNCKLCMMKRRKFAIAFPVHGATEKKARESGKLITL